ncbi:MAG: PilZ domain-containing protein [Bacteriovoracaceae bacterium]
MKQVLRQENDSQMISTLLRELLMSKTVITLWQNVNGQRITAEGLLREIIFLEKKVVIIPFKKNFSFFQQTHPIYFHTEQKSMLFKCTDFVLTKMQLQMTTPQEMKVSEFRTEARMNFKNEFNAPLIFLNGDESYRLVDISQNGASFIIPRGSLGKFYIDDRASIKGPYSKPTDLSLEASIKHISPYYEGSRFSNQFFRVGVKFKQTISVDSFLTLDSKISA